MQARPMSKSGPTGLEDVPEALGSPVDALEPRCREGGMHARGQEQPTGERIGRAQEQGRAGIGARQRTPSPERSDQGPAGPRVGGPPALEGRPKLAPPGARGEVGRVGRVERGGLRRSDGRAGSQERPAVGSVEDGEERGRPARVEGGGEHGGDRQLGVAACEQPPEDEANDRPRIRARAQARIQARIDVAPKPGVEGPARAGVMQGEGEGLDGVAHMDRIGGRRRARGDRDRARLQLPDPIREPLGDDGRSLRELYRPEPKTPNEELAGAAVARERGGGEARLDDAGTRVDLRSVADPEREARDSAPVDDHPSLRENRDATPIWTALPSPKITRGPAEGSLTSARAGLTARSSSVSMTRTEARPWARSSMIP